MRNSEGTGYSDNGNGAMAYMWHLATNRSHAFLGSRHQSGAKIYIKCTKSQEPRDLELYLGTMADDGDIIYNIVDVRKHNHTLAYGSI